MIYSELLVYLTWYLLSASSCPLNVYRMRRDLCRRKCTEILIPVVKKRGMKVV